MDAATRCRVIRVVSLSRVLSCLLFGALLTCVSGCIVTRVKWNEPVYVKPNRATLFDANQCDDLVQDLYAEALQCERAGCDSCVDLYFRVALATCRHDRQSCRHCRQFDMHKSALAKLVLTSQRFKRFDAGEGLRVVLDGVQVWVPISYHGFVWKPDDFHVLTPVGNYRTNAFKNVHRRSGVGIPLVVTRCGRMDGSFLPDRSDFAATLRLRPDCGHDCQLCRSEKNARLELYDPLRVDHADTEDGVHPIAKDISAPLAFRLRDERRTIVSDFINPDAASGENRLYTTEPYQPGKIPVVLVHGLLSDPFIWVEMVNELRARPGFVEHFQLWMFEYPTGRAFLASAAGLREQLSLARWTFDPHHQNTNLCNMVLVGHSMGGLVSKLQVTSSGDRLWRSVANRPLAEVVTTDANRRQLAAAFYFEPSPCVSRVVFIGTPHRGSAFANRFVGKIGSSLVNLSEVREQNHENLIRCNPGVFSDEVGRRIPTSIDLLEPKSRLLQAIAGLPVNCRVRMHSVIGNHCRTLFRGRSDGVVPVASARESRAISERFVDTTHSKTKSHPDSIHEVLSILQRHLEESVSQPSFHPPCDPRPTVATAEWLGCPNRMPIRSAAPTFARDSDKRTNQPSRMELYRAKTELAVGGGGNCSVEGVATKDCW